MKQPMVFTPVDMEKWERREIFRYFSQMAPTGYSVTVELDITRLRQRLRERGLRFFPAYLWLVTRALNEQPEFRTAVQGEAVGWYNTLTPLYAVFHPQSKTFSLMWTEYDDDFDAFYRDFLRDEAAYGENKGLLAKPEPPPPNAYTVSCVPWVAFRHFAVHSYGAAKPYYFPSVEAGKYYEREERLLLPLSLTCHHAAADGWHVSRFLRRLQRDMDEFQ